MRINISNFVLLIFVLLLVEEIAFADVKQFSKQHVREIKDVVSYVRANDYFPVRLTDQLEQDAIFDFLKWLDPDQDLLLDSEVNKVTDNTKRLFSRPNKKKLNYLYSVIERVANKLEKRIHISRSIFTKEGIESQNVENARSYEWPKTDESARKKWEKNLLSQLSYYKNPVWKIANPDKWLIGLKIKQVKQLRSINNSDVLEQILVSFLEQVDPYAKYVTSTRFGASKLQPEGIGVLLEVDLPLTPPRIIRVINGGPADEAGSIKPGDRIIAIQNPGQEIIYVFGMYLDEVVDELRGEKGSSVSLTMLRNETVFQVQLVRRDVKLGENRVEFEELVIDSSTKIGLLKIPTFYIDFVSAMAGDKNYLSATRDVGEVLERIRNQNIDCLIIDLRGNGGGSLQMAVDTTGLFVGKKPITALRTRNSNIQNFHGLSDIEYSGKLIVLVDKETAAGSEIFASAIKDNGRGLIVGQMTNQYGIVKAVKRFSFGRLTYSDAQHFRPNGMAIQDIGVQPDIAIDPNKVEPVKKADSKASTATNTRAIEPVVKLKTKTNISELRMKSLARQKDSIKNTTDNIDLILQEAASIARDWVNL